jgi:hypothetical protein
VIVPDLTFAATINAVLYCGATPVIVDVDRPGAWRWSVKRASTAQTKAIIPVHLYGRPAEIEPITDFAKSRGIAVDEDCASALRPLRRPRGRVRRRRLLLLLCQQDRHHRRRRHVPHRLGGPRQVVARAARSRHVAGPFLLA